VIMISHSRIIETNKATYGILDAVVDTRLCDWGPLRMLVHSLYGEGNLFGQLYLNVGGDFICPPRYNVNHREKCDCRVANSLIL
jgi:hypothetical protein